MSYITTTADISTARLIEIIAERDAAIAITQADIANGTDSRPDLDDELRALFPIADHLESQQAARALLAAELARRA